MPLEPDTPFEDYVRVTVVLDHPIAEVWAIVSSFGAIKAWIDGVEACSLAGAGVGAVRSVTRGGSVTRERLEEIVPATHSLRYALLPPYALPAEDVTAVISLRAIDDARTEVTWRSQARSFVSPREQIARYIEGFYARSLDNLGRLLVR